MQKLVIITLLGLLAATTVNASQVSQTLLIGPNTPNFGQTLTFNQFDSSLGTLNSIYISLTLNIDGGRLILDNDSDDYASGTFEFGAKGSITSTDVSLLNASFQPVIDPLSAINSGAFSLDPNEGDVANDFDSSPPDGMQYDGQTASDNGNGFVASAVWAGYIGAGTFDIDFEAMQWSDFGSVGGIEYAVNPVDADGNLTIIYDYTIPEPTTMALLSIGAFGFLKKRKTA